MARKAVRKPSRGETFAAAVRALFEPSLDEEQLLAEAARTIDLLEELDEVLRRDGALSKGSTGQVVVHPAVSEARQQRVVLLRLLGALGLALEDDAAPIAAPLQLRGRAGAAARWGQAAKDRRREA